MALVLSTFDAAKALKAKAAVTLSELWGALSMAALADSNLPSPVADSEECTALMANRILCPSTRVHNAQHDRHAAHARGGGSSHAVTIKAA